MSSSSKTDGSGASDARDRTTDVNPVGAGQDLESLRAENNRLHEEVNALRSGAEPARRRGRVRGVATVVLVVLTSIALVGATVGIWVDRTIWNTDRYVALVEPIADDPAVTQAVATRLTADVFTALDVQGRVEDALASIPKLPPSATFLAGPIASGAQDVIQRQVETFLASETFHDLWVQLNRTLHTKIVALLNGDYQELPNVAIEGGEVRLNFVSAIADVIRRVVQAGLNGLGLDVTVPEIPADLDASAAVDRLATALGVSLPEDFGQVTVMTEAQLTGYQETARQLQRLGGALALVVVLLLGLTLLVANDRRRALIWVGTGGAAALLLGGAFIRRIEARIVDSIQAPGAKAAAQDVFTEVSAGLRHAGIIVGVLALLVALVAYLAGRPAWFRSATSAVRRATEPHPGGSELQVWVARRAPAVRIASIVVATVILFWTGIDWLPVAVVAVLLGAVLWQVAVAERRAGEDVIVVSDTPGPEAGTTAPTADGPARA